MHLAELRAEQASQEHAALSSQLRHGLNFNIAASDATRVDRVTAYSDLTKPTVDTVLRTVLQDVARRDFDYLEIVATDPADAYFVAREARVYAPVTQRINLGGTLLFSHPEVAQELSGMLMASSYPLQPEPQPHAATADELESNVFPSDSAQGVYNAVQWLVADIDSAVAKRPTHFVPIGYRVRGDTRQGPRPWMLLLDNGHLWTLRHGDVFVEHCAGGLATTQATRDRSHRCRVDDRFATRLPALGPHGRRLRGHALHHIRLSHHQPAPLAPGVRGLGIVAAPLRRLKLSASAAALEQRV